MFIPRCTWKAGCGHSLDGTLGSARRGVAFGPAVGHEISLNIMEASNIFIYIYIQSMINFTHHIHNIHIPGAHHFSLFWPFFTWLMRQAHDVPALLKLQFPTLPRKSGFEPVMLCTPPVNASALFVVQVGVWAAHNILTSACMMLQWCHSCALPHTQAETERVGTSSARQWNWASFGKQFLKRS